MPDSDTVSFCCNICNTRHSDLSASIFGREDPSCPNCRSSVRMRGVLHHLSMGLFGTSLPLAEFPVRLDICGVGLSDWKGYAKGLEIKFHYENTFYHQEPLLDIVCPRSERLETCDFLISTDVFEHVPPPVERAFKGCFSMLKPGGLLVLTVPFTNISRTVEHFPDLYEYKVVKIGDEHVLINRDTLGNYTVRNNLKFHGGPGDTLEMRVFSRFDTVRHLEEAGFVNIVVHEGPVPEWGILPPHHHGLPITARRP